IVRKTRMKTANLAILCLLSGPVNCTPALAQLPPRSVIPTRPETPATHAAPPNTCGVVPASGSCVAPPSNGCAAPPNAGCAAPASCPSICCPDDYCPHPQPVVCCPQYPPFYKCVPAGDCGGCRDGRDGLTLWFIPTPRALHQALWGRP